MPIYPATNGGTGLSRSNQIRSSSQRAAGIGTALRHAYSSSLTDTDYSLFRTLLDRLR